MEKTGQDSLETQTKLAALCTYVENQPIIELILLYQRAGEQKLFMDPYFHFFIRLLSAFFSFFCQDANKTGSNCVIIGCNLLKKHKLAL